MLHLKHASTKTAAYIAGYNSVFEKLAIQGVQGKAVRQQPTSDSGDAKLEMDDQNLPAGQMANLFSQIDTEGMDTVKDDANSEENVEGRLNRPTGWSEASTIGMDDATGPSPIMSGAY